MRVTVFGATGAVGRRVVAEARARGHEVTASSRASEGDASRLADVVRLSHGRDVVISATRPVPGREDELAATAKVLLDGVRQTGVRLLLVGGAGSLILPNGSTIEEAPDFPAEIRPIAAACTEQLAVCLGKSEVDWAYLSPAALLEPGQRTGHYRLGGDELIVDTRGHSYISMEDLAVVLLDEAERPRHHRMRFTAAY